MAECRRLLGLVPLMVMLLAAAAPAFCQGDGSTAEPLGLRHRQWRTRDGLPHNTVTALAQDADGFLWLGTVRGLVRFDGQVFRVFDTTTTPELSGNFVNALLATEDGGLWIGTRRGLNRYERGAFRLYTKADGLPGEVIEDLALGPRGELWVGTRDGLARYLEGRFEKFGAEDGLAGTTVFALAVDGQGDLWVGAAEGLSRYSEGRFESLGAERGLADENVVSLEPGSDRTLWAGTLDAGLHRIDTLAFRGARAPTQLGSRLVFSLLLDREGTLWIGTRTGLARLQGEALTAVPEVGSDLIMALHEDRGGRLWVGTLQSGLHCLEAPGRPTTPESPKIVLDYVVVGQKEFLPNQSVEFPRGRADVEFHYSAVDFDTPRNLRLRHLLEGYDDYWLDAGSQLYASYTNLPPGSYRFRITSSRAAGDGHEADYDFRVPARFYQTGFFRLLSILLFAAGLWGLFLLRVRHLLRTRLLLQERISDQTREILEQRDQLEHFNRRLDEAHRQLKKTNLELKRRSREKADFLAIATHDLRAPLVNLKGFAAELRHALQCAREALEPNLEELGPDLAEATRRALREEAPEALGFIEGSAQQMEEVIGPILKMSRLSRQPLKIQAVSLGDCLHRAMARLR
ncbi:MAG: hypothetical protein KDD47_04330, partial [Acidobacteria bacterium]|nr:hypothetical protein [Acidobacteriota bacterium]